MRDQVKECDEAIRRGRNTWLKANWIGKWMTFIHPSYPDRLTCGTCLGGNFLGYLEPGNIPEFELDVQGRTGATVRIKMVADHAGICESKDEAIKKVKGIWYDQKN